MEGRALFIVVARPDGLVFRGRVADLRGWLADLAQSWRAASEGQARPGGAGPTLAEALSVWLSAGEPGGTTGEPRDTAGDRS